MSKRYKLFNIINDFEDAVDMIVKKGGNTSIDIFFENQDGNIAYIAKLQAGKKRLKLAEKIIALSENTAQWLDDAVYALAELRQEAKGFAKKLCDDYGTTAIIEEYPWSEKNNEGL
ncbi:MAG: hypothetical protein KKA79_05355 [Nanoarchaeota archaeon]|nr:hypothetical protein [Nanoarchaeota archaeon]MCG2718182.1 hypothetical protein [Nanoarchaeota archaeon]